MERIFEFVICSLILIFLLVCLSSVIQLWNRNKPSIGATLLNLTTIPLILWFIYQLGINGLDLSYNQNYMPRFGRYHLIYFATALAFLVYLFLNRNGIEKNPKPYYRFYFLTLLMQQVALYIWYYLAIDFDLSLSLPLHISRITSIFILIYFIFRTEFWSQIAFYWGLYAIGTFAWPTDLNGLNHILGWTFLISHVITLTFPFLLYFSQDWRPQKSYLHPSYGVFLLYLPFIHWVNHVTGGNYFYLVNRPFLNQLPYGIYLILVIVATYLIFWLGYGVYSRLLKLIDANQKKSASLIESTHEI